uniref:Uncharacterized protein n=1 Tax=Arundo donax TaxID=35708 RepID=A0A0A9C534_ARUDO
MLYHVATFRVGWKAIGEPRQRGVAGDGGVMRLLSGRLLRQIPLNFLLLPFLLLHQLLRRHHIDRISIATIQHFFFFSRNLNILPRDLISFACLLVSFGSACFTFCLRLGTSEFSVEIIISCFLFFFFFFRCSILLSTASISIGNDSAGSSMRRGKRRRRMGARALAG